MAQIELTKENLGDSIREIRTDKGITQMELADKAGTSFMTISRIENKSNAPSANLLIDIVSALGKKIVIK